MHIEELITNIQPLSRAVLEEAQRRFDSLIKPVGSLAQLEQMTGRYAGILGSADKNVVKIPEVRLLLLWGDGRHGREIEETFLHKRAVSVLASHVQVRVVPLLVTAKTPYDLIEEGALLTEEYIGEERAELICLGTYETALPPRWQESVPEEDGLRFLAELDSPVVSAMTGAILQAAGSRIPVILDGIAACLAALAAAKFNPAAPEFCFAGQQPEDPGAAELLRKLGLEAPLKLGLTGGEGVGALSCLQLFDAGIKAYTEMETFQEAGVHDEEEAYSLKVQEEKKRR